MTESHAYSTEGGAAAGVPLRSLLLQIRLSQATVLARAGRYSDAEILLSQLTGEEGTSIPALDLLARIRAQQGRLLDAEGLWRQAWQLDPANEAFKAGLDRIAGMQRQPLWIVFLLPLTVGLLVVLAVVLLAWQVKREMEALRSPMRDRPVERQPSVPHPAAALASLETQIRGGGVLVRREPDAVAVIFEAGLFARGKALKPEAAGRLTGFGRKLEPYVGKIAVEVIGYTDDRPLPAGGRYRDNFALGLGRAVAVVEHLRATSDLPARLFQVRSAGESQAPYANDTPENRLRNRTVVIRISTAR